MREPPFLDAPILGKGRLAVRLTIVDVQGFVVELLKPASMMQSCCESNPPRKVREIILR